MKRFLLLGSIPALFIIILRCSCFTDSKLDYESIDSIGYRFKVIATDAGQPPRSSSAYVRVNVENTNDEAPRFQSTRIERIEATKAVDSVVTTVLASDPDGDRVTYQIVSSECFICKIHIWCFILVTVA